MLQRTPRNIIVILLLAVLTLTLGCTTDGSADWQALREEANELYGQQRYEEAIRGYERAMAAVDHQKGEKDETEARLQLRQDIIDCQQALGNQSAARELLKVQMQEAHDAGNQKMEAEALMTLGMQVYETGDKYKGYEYMQQAVKLLTLMLDDQQNNDEADDIRFLLAYDHNVLMTRRGEDGDFHEVIARAKASESYITATQEPSRAENLLVRALVWRAWAYLETDSTAQADSIYAVWQQHQPVSIVAERDICHYLMKRGRYQEVLDIQQRYIDWVREKKGQWTAAERTSRMTMAEAEAALGHGDEAYRQLQQSYEISDTLHHRQAIENAQALAAEHHDREQQEQIARQRLWIAILTSIILLAAVVGLIYRIGVVRRRKDKAIVAVARNMATEAMPQPTDTTVPTDEQAEKKRFANFDRTVEQGRLYTQSDLTREMLADLMGVDRTTFSRIIQEQSDCKNLKDYLNQKRLRHAAQLLREQPNYTIQAIMQDSGFQSKSIFTTLFKQTYGMTPSEYRNAAV